jgi:hypothetical protein
MSSGPPCDRNNCSTRSRRHRTGRSSHRACSCGRNLRTRWWASSSSPFLSSRRKSLTADGGRRVGRVVPVEARLVASRSGQMSCPSHLPHLPLWGCAPPRGETCALRCERTARVWSLELARVKLEAHKEEAPPDGGPFLTFPEGGFPPPLLDAPSGHDDACSGVGPPRAPGQIPRGAEPGLLVDRKCRDCVRGRPGAKVRAELPCRPRC